MGKLRIYILLGGIITFSLLLIAQLFLIQVVNAEKYLSMAESQYVQRNYHLYERGEIYFKNKDGELVSAATLQSGYLVAISPDSLVDPEGVWEKLNSVVEVDKDQFMKVVGRGGAHYIEVMSYVVEKEAEEIKDLDLRGVRLFPQRWRFYPGERTASHVLGLVAFDGDKRVGRYGLERYYESVLVRPDSDYKVNFFAQLFGNIAGNSSDNNSESGDVVTTIEPMVQYILEEELKNIQDEWRAKSIGGIIMDPVTGEIKAMALLPDFNPNNFSSESSVSVFSNLLVEGVYEMGSVVKPITIAAGLDAGAIEPDSKYFDWGKLEVDGYTISNFDGRGHGEITMQDVLNKSVNTGVVYAVRQMGTDVFAEYIRSFGLDSKTGIDLPVEAHNLIGEFDSPRMVEYATASFGQGVAFTPIGMIRALAVLANGGYLIEPYLVERIEKNNGDIIEIDNDITNRKKVISEESSRKISRMLVNTVDEALLGGSVSLSRFSVAAKTGTAQIPHKEERGYREDVFLHSFFGYFPAYDPKFIIFLYHIEPEGAQYASQTLTSSFMDIVSFLIQYYDISPDR